MNNTTLIQEQILDLIQQFCDVLRTNYQTYAIESHRKFLDDPQTKEWHQEQIDKLCEGEGLYNFTYDKARKYAKIILHTPQGQRSAHAFVDLNTGDVYKSASWKAPAKNGVRFNLVDEKSRQEMYQRADWAGGYLYK